MPVVPFHKYLGPGNKLNNGKAISDVDKVAEIHDWRYEDAKDEKDIMDADNEAIGDFLSHLSDDPFAQLGALGLGAKHAYEKRFGVVYPMFNAHDYKKARLDPGSEQLAAPPTADWDMNLEESSVGGMASGASISGGTMSNTQVSQSSVKFTKKFQIYTGGFLFTHFKGKDYNIYENAKLLDDNAEVYASPFGVIDPDNLPLYMSETEWTLLPTMCSISHWR